jgi:MutS domain V
MVRVDREIKSDVCVDILPAFLTMRQCFAGSGKSTYLKQIAIITILAHCGSYVPAEQATIPMRDRLCCRIGNADDQEHNISTFMLEMKETAFICNNATDRSLVLVDELGRATSNEDGVAIAWSTSEYLLKKRSMTFFVTHYPQLSCLASIYPSVQNIHLEASVTRGVKGEISYTHKVKPGPCSISTDYGVELAAACGWPVDVVENARSMQSQVEDLLPDESLCQPHQSLEHVSDARTKALERLGLICADLQTLITEETAQTFESIRKDLSAIHKHCLPSSESDMIKAMDQILFREKNPLRDRSLGARDEQSARASHGTQASQKSNSMPFPQEENWDECDQNRQEFVAAKTDTKGLPETLAPEADSDETSDSASDLSTSSSSDDSSDDDHD